MHTTRQDRRRATRREVDLLVEACTGSPDGRDRATSLSLTGLRIARRLAVTQGSVVDMVVHVPGDRGPLRLRGNVVDATTDLGTGIEFGRLTTRDRLQIAEYLFG
jgi:PilZ domain